MDYTDAAQKLQHVVALNAISLIYIYNRQYIGIYLKTRYHLILISVCRFSKFLGNNAMPKQV